MVFDIRKSGELDVSSRIKALRPVELLRDRAQIISGMVCVDLGCGTGTFSLPLASMTGQQGKVFAVDRSVEMLGHLLQRNPPPNIITVQSDVSNTGLDGGIADFCLMAFILHEVREPGTVISEAARLLKQGGRALVVEWIEDRDLPGPSRQKRIGRERLRDLLRGNNFSDYHAGDWSNYYYVATAAR